MTISEDWVSRASRVLHKLAFYSEWYSAHSGRCPEVLLVSSKDMRRHIQQLAHEAGEAGFHPSHDDTFEEWT